MIRRKTLIFTLFLLLFSPAKGQTRWEFDPGTGERLLKILREGLRSEEFWPAMHAAEGLTAAGLGEEVTEYLGPKLRLESDDQKRCGLARELVRAGDRSKSAVMIQILESEDSHGHVHAAESLYKVGWKGEATPLSTAFKETDNIRLKIMAAAALAEHTEGKPRETAYEFLRQHLAEEPDPDIFRLSAWVLGRIGNDRDRRLIRSRLADAKDPVHHAFLEHALAALGDPEGNAALLRNLQSENPVVRTYAAVFSGETGLTEAAPYLIELLDDENLDLRIRAAHALLSLAEDISTQ